MPKGDFGNKRNIAGFHKNPANINKNGRPPKLVSGIIKELESKGIERATSQQVIGSFEMLFNCTQEQLLLYANDKEQPMLVRIVAKNMLDKKGFEIVEKMMDRAHGKAIQKTDLTSGGEKIEIVVTIPEKK